MRAAVTSVPEMASEFGVVRKIERDQLLSRLVTHLTECEVRILLEAETLLSQSEYEPLKRHFVMLTDRCILIA